MEEKYFIIIGRNIRRLRKSKGYTQQTFAEALKISANHVYRIENAETRVSFPLFLRIKELLGVDGNALLERQDEIGETDQRAIREVIRLLSRCDGKERAIIIRMIRCLYESLTCAGGLT